MPKSQKYNSSQSEDFIQKQNMRMAQEQQMREESLRVKQQANKFQLQDQTDSYQQQVRDLKKKKIQQERMQEKEVQRRLRDLSFDKYGVAVSGEQALKEA